MTEHVWETGPGDEGQRLDAWLVRKLEPATRSYVQKLIEEGNVLIDGKQASKCGLKLKSGMKATVGIPAPVPLDIKPQAIPLDIVFEDEAIIVINKPKDLVVHPAAGNWDGTLVNALLDHCRDSLSDINGVIRPGIVHRIDKDTTGLLVVAKNNEAHQKLSSMLRTHAIKRTYEAVVDGNLKENAGRIVSPIGRHPVNRKKMAVVPGGKPAITHYRVIKRFKTHTYIQLTLETGRTHQIRVHMAHLGHPVTGDVLYGKACNFLDTDGQALHARFLDFNHPVSGQSLHFEANLPDYFNTLIEILERRVTE